ncbi:MAG: MFS transporter [Lachnospiraceae bacterium]|nr:MFS transporter [Lachnospiraceae bacterium]
MEEKLNVKNTVLVGMAFLSICAFWQMYNNVIPLILTNTFHLDETWTGVIMAADNVLALFLLPLFGKISDSSHFAMGKRKPVILFGTIAAVALMLMLPLLDNSYFAGPARWKLAAFIGILGALLIAMGTYRSPAVALMPDVTPKPLRSKGNAIINLMGAIGGILYLIIATLLYSKARTAGKEHVSYLLLFGIVAGIMLLALVIVMKMVDEPALAEKARAYEMAHPEDTLTVTDESGRETLPPPVKRSLAFLLLSIALWFIAYNAVETWFTTYAARKWGMTLGGASLCLTIATVGAIVTYIPAGALAGKIGRRKTILAGVIMLSCCFFASFLYTCFRDTFHPALYALFVLIGVAWAMINVNSLPMVVEMCAGSDIGKFTGYYYTFSMAAQIVTPIAAGALLHRVGYLSLFPYAALFAALSFVTMLRVRHGDGVSPGGSIKGGLEAFEEMEL